MAERGEGGKITSLALDPFRVKYTPNAGGYSPGIVLGTGADWFGPLNPQAPTAPPEVAGRAFDFPSGYNLNLEPRAYEPIKFSDLRGLAESYDLVRILIETRKDQMARLQWNIKPRNLPTGEPAAAHDDPRIGKIEAFFQRPDPRPGATLFWDSWLRMLLEDLLVIDAPTLFIRRTRGGSIFALEPIDGASVKRVIDDWGRTPAPPAPAYQQTLHGLPAVNYTSRDLIYLPRNLRAHKVYGYSPVEQIVMTVNIALRRQVFQLQYYTEGNVPEALIGVPETWNPSQIREFQTWWDSILEGNTAARRHAKFVPGGVGKTFIPTKEAELKNVFDEWLARVCCFAFSISPLPFVSMMNRGTAQTSHEQSQSEGLAPIQQWVKNLIDYVLIAEFNSPDLEFTWFDDDEQDPAQAATIANEYVRMGVKSINEARDELGLDPVEGGELPMIYTATGAVSLKAASQEPEATPTAPGHETPGNDVVAAPPRGKEPAPEVGKAASVPFAKVAPDDGKEIEPLPRDNEQMSKAEKSLTLLIAGAFKRFGPAAAEQVEQILAKQRLQVTPDDALRDYEAQIVSQALDFSDWSTLVQPVQDAIGKVAMAASDEVAGRVMVGAENRDALVNQVHEEALQYARTRAAEMVGMRWDAGGNLVANPSARYAITETTREKVRELVVKALSPVGPGEKPIDLVKAIRESTAFSRERAELVALAELGNAHGIGTHAAFLAAEETGLRLEHKWTTAGDDLVESVCITNEAAGWLPLRMPFPSGDLHPLAHPRCRCAEVARVKKDSET